MRASTGIGPFRYQQTLGGGRGAATASRDFGGCAVAIVIVIGAGLLITVGSELVSALKSKRQAPAAVSIAPAEKHAAATVSVTPQDLERPTTKRATTTSVIDQPIAAAAAPTQPTLASQSVTGRRTLPAGAAADAAKWRAVARYPQLGIPNSPMNKAFVERVTCYQIQRPTIFDQAEWPTIIATEISNEAAKAP